MNDWNERLVTRLASRIIGIGKTIHTYTCRRQCWSLIQYMYMYTLGTVKLTLGTVGVGPGVGHGKVHGGLVLELEVLVLKLFAVDGLSAHSIAHGEISGLDHLFCCGKYTCSVDK